MGRLTATEVARNFSDVLDRASSGEEIEISRGGVAVAVIGPPRARFLSAERFRELVAGAPSVDEGFASDLRRLRAGTGAPESPWPS